MEMKIVPICNEYELFIHDYRIVLLWEELKELKKIIPVQYYTGE